MYTFFKQLSIRLGLFRCPRCQTEYNPTYGPCPTCHPHRFRWRRVAAVLLLCGLLLRPAPALAASNACYVQALTNGQYVTQTSGKAGTIDVYVNGAYATTISRLNQPWYATKDKKARVRGYDANGLVC